MKSLSTVGLGLSIIFGILLLALIAEVYYLLWWKNRITSRDLDLGSDISNPAADFLYVFCWKKQSSMTQTAAVVDTYSLVQQDRQQQQHDQFNINRDLLLKPLGNETSGPPKFLFPIIEETWEEMESEDSRLDSRGRSSLSELLLTAETPYVTPVASPSMLTYPLTSSSSPIHGLNNNHVSESAREAEFNRRKSSPPPKFKFLQDAEEKFRRKLMEQDGNVTSGSKDFKDEEEDEPYVAIVVDKNQETVSKSNRHHQQFQFSYSPPALSKFS